jgi:hypothetical protein
MHSRCLCKKVRIVEVFVFHVTSKGSIGLLKREITALRRQVSLVFLTISNMKLVLKQWHLAAECGGTHSLWRRIKQKISQRPYTMLKAPVPSITVAKQHWAQSVLGWVTAYKRVNHAKDWLALLLARCWSHREEGIKKHTPSAWRVALWDPSVGSGPNSAGSVWPAGNNGHASLRDAWKQTNKQKTKIVIGVVACVHWPFF